MAFTLLFTDTGLSDVKRLPKNVKNFLKRELRDKLAKDPISHSQELRAPLDGWRSFHCREYRVVFKLFESRRIIAIAGIGRHSPQASQDIYRRLEAAVEQGRIADQVLKTLRGASGEE